MLADTEKEQINNILIKAPAKLVLSNLTDKTYLYKKTSVSERFFSDDRLSLLTEEL